MRKQSLHLQGNSEPVQGWKTCSTGPGKQLVGEKRMELQKNNSPHSLHERARDQSRSHQDLPRKTTITRREPQRGLQVSDAERFLAHVCLCACLPSLSLRHSRGREAGWVRTKEMIRSRSSVSTNERNYSFGRLGEYERKKLFVREAGWERTKEIIRSGSWVRTNERNDSFAKLGEYERKKLFVHEARWVRTKEMIRSRSSVSTNERNDSFAKLGEYERKKWFVREAGWVRTKEMIRSRSSVSTNERNDSFAKLGEYERKKLFVRRWNEGARERNY